MKKARGHEDPEPGCRVEPAAAVIGRSATA